MSKVTPQQRQSRLISSSCRNLTAASIAVLVALLLGACNSVNKVSRAEPIAAPEPVDFKRVITNPALQQIVAVVGVNEGKVSGNLLKVQVELENLTYDYQTFTYEFVWFTADGMRVTTPPPLWRPGQVQGRETIYISGIAPNPDVVDFQLQLLEAE